MHGYLVHEEQVMQLRQKISTEVASAMDREKRDYLLRQQMRAIQQELGEGEADQADIRSLKEQVAAIGLSEGARKEVDRELGRLQRMSSQSADYQVTRSYIELVSELPWAKSTTDNLDLTHARKVLDEDHFDLQKVKSRILEQLAVLKLNPSAKAPILLLVGPPGVGKTSLGQSIARALGRSFERISLGGLHDEAELRGHRRTYVGAMPGRVLQAVRRAGVNNPLLLLDEIDKLGRDFRGDPSAALMEILDPAQNMTFTDNYLNLPFDLSKVFFVATANTLDTIPGPLLDRMEVLRLSAYTEEEKIAIAGKYLVPRLLRQTGLVEAQVRISQEAISELIQHYTHEAGLRQLERRLAEITRKVALRFAEGDTSPVVVSREEVTRLLGPEKFWASPAREMLRAGVATGLAWTEAGGEVLYVEAKFTPNKQGITITGQLGKVMKESVEIAMSYVTAEPRWLRPAKGRMGRAGVHVHVPAGAVPKDGPSAGIAIAVALASLYTGLVARNDTAMTGELTLTGLCLPIGGLKEKVLAANRAGIHRVLLPEGNRKDLVDLPEAVLKGTELVFVTDIEEALRAAIPGLPPKAVVPKHRLAEVGARMHA